MARAVWEHGLRIIYVGDWPARLAGPLTQALDPIVVRHGASLPPGAQAMRIVFASDLHIGPTTSPALLDRVFALIHRERPDALLLGGDHVFLDATPPRLALLRRLVSSMRCPTFAVLGNHDLWADDGAIVRTLEESGATVLINRAAALSDHVELVGLDDPWSGVCDVGQALSAARGDRFRIVVCHNPDGLLDLDDTPFDLFLAGHTHGGHLATPLGPIIVPSGRLCRELNAGFYTWCGPGGGASPDRPAAARGRASLVFVSRGVGHVEPPFRVWAPADILVLDLAPGDRRPGGAGVPASLGPTRPRSG